MLQTSYLLAFGVEDAAQVVKCLCLVFLKRLRRKMEEVERGKEAKLKS